jgi:hypothetical protein
MEFELRFAFGDARSSGERSAWFADRSDESAVAPLHPRWRRCAHSPYHRGYDSIAGLAGGGLRRSRYITVFPEWGTQEANELLDPGRGRPVRYARSGTSAVN